MLRGSPTLTSSAGRTFNASGSHPPMPILKTTARDRGHHARTPEILTIPNPVSLVILVRIVLCVSRPVAGMKRAKNGQAPDNRADALRSTTTKLRDWISIDFLTLSLVIQLPHPHPPPPPFQRNRV
mmetsp:Transcript_52576/g.140084  ORF Transcript_52576/g.140084 Transcript_52576/m.140084 type:complete len:126 (+) Transcript_52576:100-477(+)